MQDRSRLLGLLARVNTEKVQLQEDNAELHHLSATLRASLRQHQRTATQPAPPAAIPPQSSICSSNASTAASHALRYHGSGIPAHAASPAEAYPDDARAAGKADLAGHPSAQQPQTGLHEAEAVAVLRKELEAEQALRRQVMSQASHRPSGA